jgi:hypothetical protein
MRGFTMPRSEGEKALPRLHGDIASSSPLSPANARVSLAPMLFT